MDPDVVLFAVLGGLALAGRLRRCHSPAGAAARSAVEGVIRPAQKGARTLVPVVGGPLATIIGVAGTVVGEGVGEILDGAAATADWFMGRPPPGAPATPPLPPSRTAATQPMAPAKAATQPMAPAKAATQPMAPATAAAGRPVKGSAKARKATRSR